MPFYSHHNILTTESQMPTNLQKSIITTPWGPVWLAGRGDRLSGLWFENHHHTPTIQLGWKERTSPSSFERKEAINIQGWETVSNAPFIIHFVEWLRHYLNGTSVDLPFLQIYGNPFMLTVWTSLLEIPWGKTWTYRDLAKTVHSKLKSKSHSESNKQYQYYNKTTIAPLFIRSVASAVGRNPLPLLLPCHRVIGSSGNMCGYAGGVDRKIALLTHERAIIL